MNNLKSSAKRENKAYILDKKIALMIYDIVLSNRNGMRFYSLAKCSILAVKLSLEEPSALLYSTVHQWYTFMQ
jgi:hypothetical protein